MTVSFTVGLAIMAAAVVCKKVLHWVWSQGNITFPEGSHISCYHGDMHMGHSTIMDITFAWVCMAREKSLEQIHNNKQPFPFTLFMTDRC